MLRLLLLDDEEIVIKGIQKVYDLSALGFVVVGAFTNPLKALEQLEELRPDLVITDVKMPAMDGLAFAGQVKRLFPRTEVVILSGYDDFSYAQAAVKIGVSDYLLKPIKKDDFTAMLTRMREKIAEHKAREHSLNMLQRLAETSVSEWKNRYFLGLSEDDFRDDQLFAVLQDQGQMDFVDQDFLLIKVDMEFVQTQGDYMSEIGRLTQEMELLLSDYGQVLDFGSDEGLYFILYDPKPEQQAEIQDMVYGLIGSRTSEHAFFSVGLSLLHHGQGELFQARNDCIRQIFLRRANIDENIADNPVTRREVNIIIPYPEIENLFRALSAADRDGMEKSLDLIYEQPKKNIPVRLRDYISSITFLILLRIYQMQLRYGAGESIMGQELLDLTNIRREYPTIGNQKDLVLATALQLSNFIAGENSLTPPKLIQSALAYIDDHFCENISLQEVADNINISKNYLCDIFKKETGVTFMNYVTGLRIEKAKEYLRDTDMKMYEVSDAVGYNDYAYFSQIFKKNTGVTLSAYRRNPLKTE